MAKTMQQLWDYALFLLFLGGEIKDYIYGTACIVKYGAVRKFSRGVLAEMGKTKKTTYNTRAKGKGKAGTRRGRKTSNESAAGSNESRNFREEMISAF